MNSPILVDTGAIFAVMVQSDYHHEAAKVFLRKAVDSGSRFLLLDTVFAETMTLLKARVGSDLAIRVGRALRSDPAWEFLELGTDGERTTWSIFQRYDDKDWSYTDCSILAASKLVDSRRVFGFDRHLSQMPEIERLPAAISTS